MNKRIQTAAKVNIVANIILLIVNLNIGLIYASISILAKAIDSVFDVLTAIIIHYTIKIGNQKPDESHQFGHTRAESIAGYTIGILMIIFSFTLIKLSIDKIIYKEIIEYSSVMLIAVIVTLTVKLGLYIYIKSVIKHSDSPALKANAQDHLNDIFVIIGVFIAILGLKFGYPLLDPIVGILIAALIIKSGFEIIKENVNFLMGKSACKQTIDKISKETLLINGVEGINTLKTQFLGNKIQVEIHIDVDPKISIEKGQKISLEVRKEIEKHKNINDCFVHVDPKK
ncbi:MAG: cation diffusion facilitator family transporter [Candidatus Woesearchaeota archaeon]|jgi:cation diffusion facilitator family transporter|nr:cation diffusion facilitator family transporter [Candidatus Woesearchaeota archaeon]